MAFIGIEEADSSAKTMSGKDPFMNETFSAHNPGGSTSASHSVPLWREILGQTLVGRRGIVKTAHVWLPLAVFVSIRAAGDASGNVVLCLQVAVAAGCFSQLSILANDLVDLKEDWAAGKSRWISRLSPRAGILVVGLITLAGGMALVPGIRGSGALAAYCAAVVGGLLYSIKPFRLKERGILGPLAYAFACTLGYVVMPYAWLECEWTALILLAPAVLFDKWVNLHFHQVIDYDSDSSAGTRTFVVAQGLRLSRRRLRWVSNLTSALMMATLVFLAVEQPRWGIPAALVCATIAMAAAFYIRRSRRRSAHESVLMDELPSYYLGLTYALFRIMPPILFARLALLEPGMWLIFGVSTFSLLVESWHSLKYRLE